MASVGILAGWRLEQESYWADETFTLGVARLEWPAFWERLRGDSVHPPLHYVAVKIVLGAIGESLSGLRWISIAAAMGAIFFVCRAGHYWAGLLLATNAWMIHYAQELRGYTFLYAGVAALLWAIEGEKSDRWVFGIVAWMAWSHYFGVLYALAALLVYRERWRAVLGGAATLLPWLIYVAPRFLTGEAIGQLGWIQPATGRGLLRYFGKLLSGWNDAYWGAAALLSLLFITALAYRNEDRRRRAWGTMALAPPLAMFILAQAPYVDLRFFYYRYFLVSMIPAAILWTSAHRWSRIAAAGIALAVALPYTLEMRSASARFDQMALTRDLRAMHPHPPVYAWDYPYSGGPLELYCAECLSPRLRSSAELPAKFWLLSLPEVREFAEFDWRRNMRLRGYKTRAVRYYPRRPDFQLYSLEIVEYERAP